MIAAKEMRKYEEDIDWVYFEPGVGRTPAEIEATVADLRRQSIKFVDRVPPKNPPLESPCNF